MYLCEDLFNSHLPYQIEGRNQSCLFSLLHAPDIQWVINSCMLTEHIFYFLVFK